jgi:hypothetical protein
MSCPSCGIQVGEQDRFCSYCGKSLTRESLTVEQETELFSFGPVGVNVCFSRPPRFVGMQQNTRIVVTNRQIRGSNYSIFGAGSLLFQVPYNDILAKEIFDFKSWSLEDAEMYFGLWKVLWIKYRDEGEVPLWIKEVSIMVRKGVLSNSQDVERAYDLIQKANR